MQQLRASLICLGACVLMGAMNAIPNTSEHENARDEAAVTGKNSHVGGMGGAKLRVGGAKLRGYGISGGMGDTRFSGYGMGGAKLRGYGIGGGMGDTRFSGYGMGSGFGGIGGGAGRRKRATDGYFGGTGARPGSFSSGARYGGFGNRRKKRGGGSVGGKVAASGSRPSGIEYGDGMSGGWRRKRATDAHGLDKGVVSDSLRSDVGYHYPYYFYYLGGSRSGFGIVGLSGIAPGAAWVV